jgi:hypothetical protein
MNDNARLEFWSRWLFGVTVLTAAFGLFLMLAPTWTRQGFSLLFHATPGHFDALGTEAARYITFIHAALGAAITGWGIVLMAVARGPFRRGTREGWLAIAASLTAWFVPDVVVSLWFGYWQNVVLDGVFAVLYAAPLIGTWRLRRGIPATG